MLGKYIVRYYGGEFYFEEEGIEEVIVLDREEMRSLFIRSGGDMEGGLDKVFGKVLRNDFVGASILVENLGISEADQMRDEWELMLGVIDYRSSVEVSKEEYEKEFAECIELEVIARERAEEEWSWYMLSGSILIAMLLGMTEVGNRVAVFSLVLWSQIWLFGGIFNWLGSETDRVIRKYVQ